MENIMEWKSRVSESPPSIDLIDDILADTHEINAIVGRSGIGKTNLALHLAHALASGTEFLGHNVRDSRAVGYIGFEGDERKLLERVNKISRVYPNCWNLWFDPVCRMFKVGRTPNSQAAFREKIAGLDVLIIDPVRYMVDGDYTKPDVATEFLSRLQDILQETKTMAILTLHFKKMDNRDKYFEPGDLWSIKGATEWGDMSATVLMLERSKQGHKTKEDGSTLAPREGGGFAPADKDRVTLYFAKTRHAVNAHDPIPLRLNRAKCLFERE